MRRLTNGGRVPGLDDQFADVACGELSQHGWMHDVLLAGSLWAKLADGIRTRPRSQTRFSRPRRAAWFATAPEMDRLAVVTADLEALEPGRPALVEDPIDADLIAR